MGGLLIYFAKTPCSIDIRFDIPLFVEARLNEFSQPSLLLQALCRQLTKWQP